ncbi:unnamed protein product [Cyprideis torosa]|uniref:Uncharacterized protein n=1 Tax=Cyprideis torosa TaxID=163714 RepID=A0A7R8WRE0_9CRUS|nr:unnamed protein product [Cyprideis torosa]CAG0908696.1 unnamed protein product [Cyprideis torosa]
MGISTEVMNRHLRLRNHLPTSSPATAITTSVSVPKPIRQRSQSGSSVSRDVSLVETHLTRVPREDPTNTPAIISPEG